MCVWGERLADIDYGVAKLSTNYSLFKFMFVSEEPGFYLEPYWPRCFVDSDFLKENQNHSWKGQQ